MIDDNFLLSLNDRRNRGQPVRGQPVVEKTDLAVVVILRQFATALGDSDAMAYVG